MSQGDLWACKKCNTTDIDLRYTSGKMLVCKDCQKFKNLKNNSNFKRKRKRNPEILISEEEFLIWLRKSDRQCHYCGLKEKEIHKFKIKSQIGLGVESLGIDRIDNSGDYTLDNIALCCLICNKIKSNFFSENEMKSIGTEINHIWNKRLEE